MKKYLVLLLLTTLIFAAGCKQTAKDYSEDNALIQSLFPNQSGFRWFYNGYAEYGHSMTLDAIDVEENKITYHINGQVDDASGGEGSGEYHLTADYTIERGALYQVIDAPMIMDKNYQTIVLIKTPLEAGATWEQLIVDQDNNEIKLKSTIEQITATDEGKTYKVRYQEQDSDYYEIRVIREGIGVIQFSRLFTSGKESYEIGYALYEEISGIK